MRKIVVLLIVVVVCLRLGAQESLPSWILSSQEAGNKNYVARDSVSFLPGFDYAATDSCSLNATVNPALVFIPQTNLYARPDGTIDSNEGIVGTLPGQFSVSRSGGASYTIPIECLEGINNLQPHISLNYNSQSGNGLLGWGWSLGGISVLSRTGSTLYHDSKVAPIKMSAEDNWMLDGQRLILITPGNGHMAGAKFRTEIESYQDMTMKLKESYLYLEVKTKEGLTIEYGSSPDSRLTTLNTAWYISKVTDGNGNYIKYSYLVDEETPTYSSIRIDKIEYGGNAVTNTPLAYKILFSYSERPDTQISYIYDKEIRVTRLLKDIKIVNGTNELWKYDLKYNYNEIQSKITSITLSAGNSTYNSIHYNPTQILWGNEDSTVRLKNLSVSGLCTDDSKYFCYSDFNADGRIDILVYNDITKKIHLYLASVDSNGFYECLSLSITENNTFEEILTGDFDGNSLLDFVLVTKDSSNRYVHDLYRRIKIENLVDTFEKTSSFTSSKKALVGDFDGDGMHELLNEETSSILKLEAGLLTTIGGGGITWGEKVHTTQFPNNRYLLDFDGDGKSDVLILTSNGFCIYTLKETSSGLSFCSVFSGSYPNKDTGVYFGDFNGDGMTDLLTQKLADNETALLLSKGNSFRERKIASMKKYLTKLFIGDFNGDGKSDFACLYHPSGSSPKFVVGYSNTYNFREELFNTCPNVNYISVGNFNGDNKDDILQNFYTLPCSQSTGPKMVLYTYGQNDERLLVKQITNGSGQDLFIDYACVTDTTIYSDTLKTMYSVLSPITLYSTSLKVVSKYREGAGSSFSETEMKYSKGRVHKQGKGFLGFEKIEMANNLSNTRSFTEYCWDNDYCYPGITKQQTFTVNNTPISTNEYTNTIISLGGKRILPYISKTISKDHLTGLSTKVEILEIDNSGNPLNIRTIKGDHVEIKSLSYLQKGAWCKNKIDTLVITSTLAEESYTRKTEYEYDDRGNLIKERLDPGDVNCLTTEYVIDSFGNRTQTTTTTNNGVKTANVVYSTSGLFILHSTDEFGRETTYDWDQTTCLLTNKIDHQGRATQYIYNKFGTLKETIFPDGSRKAEENLWASPNSIGAKYYTQIERSGMPSSFIWYDHLNREILAETYGFNNRKQFVKTEYNEDGTIYRVSEPTFENDIPIWGATYDYDQFGRTLLIATPSGETSFIYAGVETTVNTPDEVKITHLNNTGKVDWVQTNGKYVNYTYYPSGLLRRALPERQLPVELDYNLQGNRILLVNADVGVIRSEYDGFGNLLWERQKIHLQGDSITTSYLYSPEGLLHQISQNGRNKLYTYDNQKRISAINIAGEHRQSFIYDDYDRVITTIENVGGKMFEHTTEYTLLGQVKKEIYPSGYYIKNAYDVNGFLTEVRDDQERLIWKPLEVNAKGQITHEKKGEQEVLYEFDSRGLPTAISSGNIIDMTFSFTDKTNLAHRIDHITNHKEVFEYDNLNRLTQWDIYKNEILSKSDGVTYNASGTINSTSTLDDLLHVYGGGLRDSYQLTSIEGLPEVIPSANLNVTYSDFKKVKNISEGNKSYSIGYGVDDQRCYSSYSIGGVVQQVRYYQGNYEEEINQQGIIKRIHYLPGGAIYMEEGALKKLYYTYTDYLGSLVAITSENGSVLERHAFTPWGIRRNPLDWTQNDERTSWIINRGFTMHEHLDVFNMINMNGRIYDPTTSLFLSPDPFIQTPDNWLNYNRYGYCLNNPLKYTDPSGEIIWTIILGAAIIGGATNVAANWDNIDNFWQGLGYLGVGAVAGSVGAAAGAWVAGAVGVAGVVGGVATGAAAGAASGFVQGGGNTLLAGGGFSDFMGSSIAGMFVGGATGAVIGGAVGGVVSYSQGKNIWSGADISSGRNAFSFNNSPITNTTHSGVAGSEPSPLPPSLKPEVLPQNNRSYSITTYEGDIPNPMMEGREIVLKPLQIEGYDARIGLQRDLYHDFPRHFDKIIVKDGWLYGTNGNSTMMVAPGVVNGANGMYTIGINNNTGIIYHRVFYKWDDFMKWFKF